MKVLHLPESVGGMAWGLAQAEKKLGLDSLVLVRSNNWLNYPYDISLEWQRKSKIRSFLSCVYAFLKYRNLFDVFHFNFGSTLIDFRTYGVHHLDLPFYPKDKKLIFTYNGCDARQKYKTLLNCGVSACHQDNCYNGMCYDGKFDRKREKSITIVSKYAHHIFAVNPDLLHFLPEESSSFLPYTIPSWHDIKTVSAKIEKKIRILHSPTNREAKGSSYILTALNKLSKKYKIEIMLIENIPNKEALKLYQKADLVIDQVLIGWYGSFAVEVMKMGKPVAVYIRNEDLKYIPGDMAADLKKAVIEIDIFNIERVLEEYLQNPSLLSQKSQAALDYVHRWHEPAYVASLTKEIYER